MAAESACPTTTLEDPLARQRYREQQAPEPLALPQQRREQSRRMPREQLCRPQQRHRRRTPGPAWAPVHPQRVRRRPERAPKVQRRPVQERLVAAPAEHEVRVPSVTLRSDAAWGVVRAGCRGPPGEERGVRSLASTTRPCALAQRQREVPAPPVVPGSPVQRARPELQLPELLLPGQPELPVRRPEVRVRQLREPVQVQPTRAQALPRQAQPRRAPTWLRQPSWRRPS